MDHYGTIRLARGECVSGCISRSMQRSELNFESASGRSNFNFGTRDEVSECERVSGETRLRMVINSGLELIVV